MPQIFASDKQKKPESIGALSKFSNSVVELAPSVIHFNSTATFNGVLENTSTIQCDITTSGAGGLDTGAEASSTYYNIFAVNNSGTLALVASVSTSPTGFSEYKWVGVAVNDASSDFDTVTNKMTITRLTSGSGTYNAPNMVKRLKITAVGGGGGGSSGSTSGVNEQGLGSDGNDTTFGSIITANGGKRAGTTIKGDGGAATLDVSIMGYAITGGGGSGGGGGESTGANQSSGAGAGGSSFFGGGGSAAAAGSVNGSNGAQNTGGGGGGRAEYDTYDIGGGGGGAGGTVIAYLYDNLDTPYSYSVGAGGAGGNSNGGTGGDGGSGVIIIEEYYS